MRHQTLLSLLLLLGCGGSDPKGDPVDSGTDTPDSGEVDPDQDADGDGYVAADDCDDENPQAYPGATETCNGLDDDCDGDIDNDAVDPWEWYVDLDGDSWGIDDPATNVLACDTPYRMVARSGDCDDGSSRSYPGAFEICDGRDNDCDRETDEGPPSDAPMWYRDQDGDGYGSSTSRGRSCEAPDEWAATNTHDCDDTNADINPRQDEVIDDGLDNNCDGWTDLWGISVGVGNWEITDAGEWAGDRNCLLIWETTGTPLSEGELCYGCTFGFETDWVYDAAHSHNDGTCDSLARDRTMFGALRPAAGEYGDTWMYSTGYSYYYGTRYWYPWPDSWIYGTSITYASGYLDAELGGLYYSNYIWSTFTVE